MSSCSGGRHVLVLGFSLTVYHLAFAQNRIVLISLFLFLLLFLGTRVHVHTPLFPGIAMSLNLTLIQPLLIIRLGKEGTF